MPPGGGARRRRCRVTTRGARPATGDCAIDPRIETASLHCEGASGSALPLRLPGSNALADAGPAHSTLASRDSAEHYRLLKFEGVAGRADREVLDLLEHRLRPVAAGRPEAARMTPRNSVVPSGRATVWTKPRNVRLNVPSAPVHALLVCSISTSSTRICRSTEAAADADAAASRAMTSAVSAARPNVDHLRAGEIGCIEARS
jgi:hypothetical protein